MINRYKTSCILCKKEVQNRYFAIHKCKTTLTLDCVFCGRQSLNLNSAAQHLIRCEKNPDKIDLSYLTQANANLDSYRKKIQSGEIKHINQYSKAERLGLPKPVVSPLVSERRKELNRLRKWTIEDRKKHSDTMKQVVAKNPESYTSANRGRTKQIIYNEIKFQGRWELKFYKWCEHNNIKCERNFTGFSYFWNGDRLYYPDFYLTDLDYYVEVKGYQTERDIAKWNQFPKKLLIIEKKSITEIDKAIYKLPIT